MRHMTTVAALATFALCLASCATKTPPAATASPTNQAAAQPAATPTPALAATPAPTGATGWPQFRGPKADGYAPDTGINKDWTTKPPALLWKVTMTDDGYAGPAVANGKLFIIDHQANQDVVRAIDLRDGKDAWTYAYADTDSKNYGFARSTPAYSDGKLYTQSRLGVVNILDAKTGKLIHTRNIVAEFAGLPQDWDLSASPVIDGAKLLLVPGGKDALMIAIDTETGKVIWKGGGTDKAGYATPVIATLNGKRQYLIFSGTRISGLDPDTGATIWSYPWQTDYDVNAAAPLVYRDTVFITSGYGHGCAAIAVNGAKTTLRWQNKDIQSHFSSPVLAEGYIYSTSDPGNLVCMDANTGKVMWKQSGFEKGGLVAVDGTLIVMSGSSGETVMVKMAPDGYQELGRFKPLGGQSWTAPIVADGKLILRNKKTLACYALK